MAPPPNCTITPGHIVTCSYQSSDCSGPISIPTEVQPISSACLPESQCVGAGAVSIKASSCRACFGSPSDRNAPGNSAYIAKFPSTCCSPTTAGVWTSLGGLNNCFMNSLISSVYFGGDPTDIPSAQCFPMAPCSPPAPAPPPPAPPPALAPGVGCPCDNTTHLPQIPDTCLQHIDRECSLVNINKNDHMCEPCVKFALGQKDSPCPPHWTPSNVADIYCNCYGCCSPPRHITRNGTLCECPSSKVGTKCDVDLWNASPYSSLYCTSEGCSTGAYSDKAEFNHVMECNEDCQTTRNILLYFMIIVALIVYVIFFVIFFKRGTKKSIIIKKNNI